MVIVSSKILKYASKLLGMGRSADGLAFYPFIILEKEELKEDVILINHERIHLEQQKELWIIPFYIIYFYYIWKVGYDQNPFEKEAYQNQMDLNYIKNRKKYNWKHI